jgi:hypothetical protein
MISTCRQTALVFLVLVFVWISGCGKLVRRDGGKVGTSDAESTETEFSAVDPERDYFTVPERVPDAAGRRIASGQIDWHSIDSLRRAETGIDSVTTIYRVQLFASQYYSEAGYEKEIAEDVFSEPIYIVYDVPYYKILMGNCTDVESGRRLLEHARSLGYGNGWLVESPPDSIYYDFYFGADSLMFPDSAAVDEFHPPTEDQ